MIATWLPRDEHFRNLANFYGPANHGGADNGANPLIIETPPADITVWLSNLSLLAGCPLNYLIPDEKLLPVESLRFFYLDSNWILSLMDGACSIGRVTSGDYSHDLPIIDTIRNQAIRNNQNIRAAKLGKSPEANQTGFNTESANAPNPGNLNPGNTAPVCTGFLLRSDLVKGWPGLETQAYDNPEGKGNPLNIIRMEKLSDNTLICIFNGIFKRLELLEPPEGLHYGADPNPETPGAFRKELRLIESDGENPAGTLIKTFYRNPLKQDPPPPTWVDLVMKKDPRTRVVAVAQTAQKIQFTLGNLDYPTTMTAAEFAVEMVEDPAKGVFVAK